MHRKNILNLLQEYLVQHKDEENITKRFIKFVEENSECFNRTLLKGHLTGSAWLLNKNRTHVLLTHHKKLNKWLQLGGHADGDSDILNVAIKEVEEESGLTDLTMISNGIFDLDAHLIPARKDEPEHYHYDVRFAFVTNGNENYIVSNESFDLQWIKLDDITKKTSEKSILRMLDKTSNLPV